MSTKKIVTLYILADVICVGAGMGVPFFCILLGFPLGWHIAQRTSAFADNYHELRRILNWSFGMSFLTFLQMIVIWGKAVLMLFNPASDFRNFGHPFILFEPKASFIGWLILMIFISPFLQLLTTVFSAFLALVKKETRR